MPKSVFLAIIENKEYSFSEPIKIFGKKKKILNNPERKAHTCHYLFN